jgi:hypothetical protein
MYIISVGVFILIQDQLKLTVGNAIFMYPKKFAKNLRKSYTGSVGRKKDPAEKPDLVTALISQFMHGTAPVKYR